MLWLLLLDLSFVVSIDEKKEEMFLCSFPWAALRAQFCARTLYEKEKDKKCRSFIMQFI